MIYGTAWKGDKTCELVIEALKAGFTAFDTAAQPQHYREDQVGRGLQIGYNRGFAKRNEVYIQTKFTSFSCQSTEAELPYNPNLCITEQVRASFISSLRNLKPHPAMALEEVYLDCLILHSPFERMEDTLEAWKVFEECVPNNVRQLGISNVTIHELSSIYDRVDIKPSVVQNPFTSKTDYDRDVRRYCAKKGIRYQSFWTLTANLDLLQSKPVVSLASEATVNKEVALYGLICGLTNIEVLNGTKNPETMKRDLEQMASLEVWKTNKNNINAWKDIFGHFLSIIGSVS